MKLILTQEVSGLGAPGDVVEVKDGYGRNYLLPARRRDPLEQGRASAPSTRSRPPAPPARSATPTTPTRSRPSSRPARSPVKVKAGESGRLFGAVTAADIADRAGRGVRRAASTSAPSWSATRSSRWAPTRCRSSCTTRCPPRSPSTSSRPDPLQPRQGRPSVTEGRSCGVPGLFPDPRAGRSGRSTARSR